MVKTAVFTAKAPEINEKDLVVPFTREPSDLSPRDLSPRTLEVLKVTPPPGPSKPPPPPTYSDLYPKRWNTVL